MELKDRVALITGASRGIGKAVARRFTEAGARVCVNSWHDERGALDTVEKISAAGGDAFQVQADVSDESAVNRMIRMILDRWSKIDILVNNAGISGAGTSFFEITGDAWDHMLKVNLKSVFLCSRAVLPQMVEKKYGRIINIASIAGVTSLASSNAHYAAAKGGMLALTKRMARDFAPYNISVNAVAPGLVRDTGFNERMPDEKLASYVSQIPMGRPVFTRDIVGMAAFLATEEAGFVTGQIICVDGGTTC